MEHAKVTTAAAENGYLIGRKCSSAPGCCREKKKKPSRTVMEQRGIMEMPQSELLFIECLLFFYIYYFI